MITFYKNLAPNLKKWVLLAFAIHLIAAIFSTGFKHFDEHFQILEFVNFKLGLSTPNDLPWEFGEQMRPWAQPFFSYVFVLCCKFIGINSPFSWATGLRIISSLLGMTSIILLAQASFKWLKSDKSKILLLQVLALTWFIPYFHARNSSESWSSIFFTIGMSLAVINSEAIKQNKKLLKNSLLIAIPLGLSFLFRYQVGFMIMGIFLWFLLCEKNSFKFLSLIILIILSIIAGGVLIDSWGYGNFAIAPWNYFYINIFESRTAQFGIHPWWHYFKLAITRGYPPISIIVIISILWGWVKFPKHVLTWTTIPFTLIHFLIAHQETRFLIPVFMLSPIFFVLLWEQNFTFFKTNKIGRLITFFIIGINCIFLTLACLKPSKSAISFYQYLYDYKEDKISTITSVNDNPFMMVDLPVKFYLNDAPKISIIKEDALKKLESPTVPKWILTQRIKHAKLVKKHLPLCTISYSNFPMWSVNILLETEKFKNLKAIILFKCIN